MQKALAILDASAPLAQDALDRSFNLLFALFRLFGFRLLSRRFASCIKREVYSLLIHLVHKVTELLR